MTGLSPTDRASLLAAVRQYEEVEKQKLSLKLHNQAVLKILRKGKGNSLRVVMGNQMVIFSLNTGGTVQYHISELDGVFSDTITGPSKDDPSVLRSFQESCRGSEGSGQDI